VYNKCSIMVAIQLGTSQKTAGTSIIGGPFLGGNFWSDYTGVDTDNDKLGNTLLPHRTSGGIPAPGGDFLPLTTKTPPPVVRPTGRGGGGGGFPSIPKDIPFQLPATEPEIPKPLVEIEPPKPIVLPPIIPIPEPPEPTPEIVEPVIPLPEPIAEIIEKVEQIIPFILIGSPLFLVIVTFVLVLLIVLNLHSYFDNRLSAFKEKLGIDKKEVAQEGEEEEDVLMEETEDMVEDKLQRLKASKTKSSSKSKK